MGFFDVDYDKHVWENLPVDERGAVRYAWLKALIAPVKYVYGLFVKNRDVNLYDLAHNGQVFSLEAALNDTFDPASRGIYIDDGPVRDALYIYKVSELKPVYIDLVSEIGTAVIPDPDPVPLYLVAEGPLIMGVPFIVHVPVAVVFDMARMRALIDHYKLVGTAYSIVTF